MKRGDVFRRTARIAAILVLTGAVGCSRTDDLPRQPVWGRVSFDGAPLDKAWIEFRPDGEGGVTAAGTQILGGSYSIPLAEGLIPGKYRVAINKASPPDESEPGPNPSGAPLPKRMMKVVKMQQLVINRVQFAKQLIPARYNTESDLVLEVKADKNNEFDFKLTSK